jgi:myo-inositol-1(or 4)-monophosphatase
MNGFLATALEAAEAAAAAHLRWSGRVGVDGATAKGPGDFVSGADYEAQAAATAVIQRAYPDHEVMAEEDEAPFAKRNADVPLWVVDPLDGTANFLHGHPMFGSSVAVAISGKPVAGAVVCASTGERWWAESGGGAFKNGIAIHVSKQRRLQGALVGTGFPFKAQHLLPEYLEQLGGVLRAGSGVRRGGAAAIDLCYVAEGRFDGFWELHLNPWDFAAGMLIIAEAGGEVTALDGSPLELVPGSVLAANGSDFLAELLSIVETKTGTAAAPPSPSSAREPAR